VTPTNHSGVRCEPRVSRYSHVFRASSTSFPTWTSRYDLRRNFASARCRTILKPLKVSKLARLCGLSPWDDAPEDTRELIAIPEREGRALNAFVSIAGKAVSPSAEHSPSAVRSRWSLRSWRIGLEQFGGCLNVQALGFKFTSYVNVDRYLNRHLPAPRTYS
jgi:hypothetical protein